MFVVNFNEKVTLGLPATIPFTDRPTNSHARSPTRRPWADGALRRDRQSAAAIAGGQPDRKVLIVVSDGGDNARCTYPG